MPNIDLEIKNIQFKRGKKAVLEAKLVEGVLGVPTSGEPIYETDTKKLKIGILVFDDSHDFVIINRKTKQFINEDIVNTLTL